MKRLILIVTAALALGAGVLAQWPAEQRGGEVGEARVDREKFQRNFSKELKDLRASISRLAQSAEEATRRQAQRLDRKADRLQRDLADASDETGRRWEELSDRISHEYGELSNEVRELKEKASSRAKEREERRKLKDAPAKKRKP